MKLKIVGSDDNKKIKTIKLGENQPYLGILFKKSY